jgi:hypothetical protein
METRNKNNQSHPSFSVHVAVTIKYCKKNFTKQIQRHGNKEQSYQSHPPFSVQVTSLHGYPFTSGERLP